MDFFCFPHHYFPVSTSRNWDYRSGINLMKILNHFLCTSSITRSHVPQGLQGVKTVKDTFCFQQFSVVVEGDTELALLIKNTLDALPAPKTRKLIRVLHRGMDRLTALRIRRAIVGRVRSP